MAFPIKFSTFDFSGNSYDPEEERKKRERGMFSGLLGDFNVEDDPQQDMGVLNQSETPAHPQSAMMDAYRELINHQDGPAMLGLKKYLDRGYPDEKDYKPGKLTRLGAILSGVSTGLRGGPGYQVAREIVDEPYQQAIQKYKDEGGRLSAAANLEESQYQHKLTGLRAAVDDERQQENLERQIRADNSLIQQRIDEAKRRGEVVITDHTTGHSYNVNKDTGERISDLGKIEQTPSEKSQQAINQAKGIAEATSPIIEGRQSRLEGKSAANAMNRARFTAGQAMERAKFSANAGMARVAVEQGNRIALSGIKNKEIQARIRLRDQLATNRAASKQGLTAGSMSAGQERLNINDALALYDSDPDRYSKVFDEKTLDLKYGKGNIPPVGTQEYNDYVDMYNKIYKGVSQLSHQQDPRLIVVPDKQ